MNIAAFRPEGRGAAATMDGSSGETKEKHVSEQRRRILVVANRTCPCQELLDEVERHASAQPSEVLIVAPALNKRLKHLASDTDAATGAAEQRLAVAVEGLAAAGIEVTGTVGDADPGQAIEDALRSFAADELIVSTHPPGASHWLEKGLIERARRTFDGPVTHFVSHYGIDENGPEPAVAAAGER